MAAPASSRALLFSRLSDLSIRHHKPPSFPCSHHLLFRNSKKRHRSASASAISCIISGIDGGGGVSDDSLSTSSFCHGFSVIADMLKKIEPLDTSVISKGVSDSVKDSMKQMISTMLGLLPSDQFSVTVRVSKRPLVRLFASSLITGYTLWNAEYRLKLMRNFETSPVDMLKMLNSGDCDDVVEHQSEEYEEICDSSVEMDCFSEDLEGLNIQSCLDDLSPDALKYIQELKSELSTAKQELHTQKQECAKIRYATGSKNDVLKYLRSLDSDMVNELSRPSSLEVKQVLQQLVLCTSRRVFKEEITSGLMGDSEVRVQENYKHGSVNFCETRDHLAKLLFWCMLLGHQLRGLENRLYLTCAVGF